MRQSTLAAHRGRTTYVPVRTNISFSVVAPAVIGQASHQPSPAPGVESQLASSPVPVHGSPTRPSTHATGRHVVRSGIVERRVTRRRSKPPSGSTPLLKSAH